MFTEGLITHTLYDVAREILKKDPIRSAIDQTIDELEREKQAGWFELREIDRHHKEIFDNINITEEATFLKILTKNGILPVTASKLYKKFSEKFYKNIKEAATKEPEVFYRYAIREFEKNNTNSEELNKFLTKFAYKVDVNLERIIEHFNELEKITVNIPTIQSVLRKRETIKGGFFKKEPEWIDFEQGYIVERKEVSEIIKKLETDKVQLVLGEPASGKSVILKNVGFRLVNDNKNAYAIELKKHQGNDVKLYFEAIPQMNNDNSIFIVDDAHLYPSDCERLIKDFKSGGKGKLIIGSRPTKEILPTHPKKISEFQFLNKTEIHSEDVTEEMITTFLKKQYKFGDDKIETVSKNLKKYKNDLWQLSWALNAYKHDKDSVDDEEIYENIIVSITEIETKDKGTINAEDAFFPLSVFYRFEIPIERDFLEEHLKIKKDILNQLIELSEILETREKGNRLLSLHHSSLAELFFIAYQNYHSFGKKVKKNILNGKNERSLEYCLFYRYLTTTDPSSAINVIIYLGWKDNGKTLLKKLSEENKIQEIIENEIEKENNIEKIGECIWIITVVNPIAGWKLANNIDINILSSKIEKEGDIEKIGMCVRHIAWINKDIVMKLFDSVSSKIEKEEDIKKIRECINHIAQVSKEAGIKLVPTVLSKIEKEEDLVKIGWCVLNIVGESREVGLELVNRIDIDTLLTKIEKEEDIGKIVEFVWAIVKASNIVGASKKVGLKLVETINIDILSSKINKEEDIEKIEECVRYITKVSGEVGLKLANSIDINILSSKIEKEGDIEKIGKCVGNIARANKEVGLKLVNTISAKIEKEDDITKIGEYAVELARNNREMGLKLVDSIDIEILLSKIKKEEDNKAVGMCVANIGYGNEEKEKEIINHLNPKIRKEIEKKLPHWKNYVKLMALRF